MKKFIYTTLTLGILCGLASCRKFVEIPTENLRVLKLTTDYQQLLYSTTTMDVSYYNPIFSGDDIGSDDIRWQNSLSIQPANVYSWTAKTYTATEEDADWVNLYKQIFLCNNVVQGVMQSEGGSESLKKSVLSAALVHRAFAYFTLVNLYGKQYDAATAASDPGVPLVLVPAFSGDLTRASVQKVYDQIGADLDQALPALPEVPDFNSNPSKAAAYALLARVALNKRAFTDAERYADLTLAIKNTLIDLSANVAVPPALPTMPTKLLNPEEIFFKRTSSFPVAYPLSADAVNMFTATAAAAKDLRYVNFTASGATLFNPTFNTPTYFRPRLVGDGGNYTGLSVPEMLLIKAECEARAGNTAAAVGVLNTLRKKRFKAADYVDFTATDANAALHLVVDERKREFMGRGFRWFDQRRLAKDAGFISTVTRVFKGVTYTLEPGSDRYTYAIGDKYIDLNPEIIQNPR